MGKVLSEKRLGALQEFAKKIDVSFAEWNHLHQALTHTSYANEGKRDTSLHNERLEFLGDAVLELVISTYLYKHFPDLPEGELTKARAAVVCETTLAKRASKLGIGEYLLFGKGELITGGRERASILADAFEAVIGAIYLSHGMEYASAYIVEQLHDDLQSIETGKCIMDYKTVLQEVVQKSTEHQICYDLLSEEGPDHDKLFKTAVIVNGKKAGIGLGKSKKESEQRAAQEALEEINKTTHKDDKG